MHQFILGKVMGREIPTADGFCYYHLLTVIEDVEVPEPISDTSSGEQKRELPGVVREQHTLWLADAGHQVRNPSHHR